MRGIVNHAQSNGFNGRAGESGGNVGDARRARLGVDGDGNESIDQRDGVGAGLLCDMRHLRDAGYVGRELNNQRAAGGALRGAHYFIERAGIAAELQSAFSYVGAGDVEFVGSDAFTVVENFNGAFVIFAGVAEYIGDDDAVFQLPEPG